MRIGVPKETMRAEHRIALTPAGARELVSHGHEVLVEAGGGIGSSLTDAMYERAGARMVGVEEAWRAELVLKVKEPLSHEFRYFREGQMVFTFLHLAAHPELTRELAAKGVTAISYETVQLPDGRLPLLAPMSEIAGRVAPHAGAHYLEKQHGLGILLGGVSGVRPARVVVIGCGVAGRNAAWLAAGMEAEVLLLDKNIDRLREVDVIHRGRIMTLYSNQATVEDAVRIADLVIGAVLIPGAKAPVVVPESLVKEMKPGSVIVDLSIDQGGCIETAHVTTHEDPIYTLHDVIHYCVGNVPGAVPNTSTHALVNVTLSYTEKIANHGLMEALRSDPALAKGLNVYRGHITNEGVAAAHAMPFVPIEKALASA